MGEKMLVITIDDDVETITQDSLSNFKEGNILVIPETVKKITEDVLFPMIYYLKAIVIDERSPTKPGIL